MVEIDLNIYFYQISLISYNIFHSSCLVQIMGSSPETGQAISSRLNVFRNTNAKLLVYSVNQYSPEKQFLFDHHEIQALIQTKDRYEVLRISYSKKGMLVDFLSSPRYGIRYSKKTVRKIVRSSQKYAFQLMGYICQKYAGRQLSIMKGIHCQAFCEQVVRILNDESYRIYQDLWEIYDEL